MVRYILITILITVLGCQYILGQGVNSITIEPNNPTSEDAIQIISDFSYYGNCSNGLVNAQIIQSGSIITIYPEYCGYGETTLCNAIDTFSLGVLPIGNYTINIEYHQGTVCGGNFDTIIANFETTFQIESTLSIEPVKQTEDKIIVYPNPADDFITIQHNKLIKTITLFDITGKELMVTTSYVDIDLSAISCGIYLLDIQLENGEHVVKKIVKK